MALGNLKVIYYSLSVSLSLHSFIKRHFAQGLRFIVVGGLGATVDLGGSAVFVNVFHASPYLATACSTLLSVTVVFLGNKFFTFRSRGQGLVGRQAVKFALVYGAAILENLGVTWLLIHLGVHYLMAKVVAIGIGVLWNYFMSHAFVFRGEEEPSVTAV